MARPDFEDSLVERANWSSTGPIAWNNSRGDWWDANLTAQGSTAWQTVEIADTDTPRDIKFDVTSLFQAIYDNPNHVCGVLLRGSSGTATWFAMKNWATAGQRPKISYDGGAAQECTDAAGLEVGSSGGVYLPAGGEYYVNNNDAQLLIEFPPPSTRPNSAVMTLYSTQQFGAMVIAVMWLRYPLESAPSFGGLSRTALIHSTNATTVAFTPPNNSLLVAYVSVTSFDGPPVDARGDDMTITDSAGLTWTRVIDSGALSPTWDYGAAIFTAPVTTGVSMTVTRFDANVQYGWMSVYAYTGFDAADPVGATAYGTTTPATGAGSITLDAAPVATSDVLAFSSVSLGSGSWGLATPASGWITIAETGFDTWHDWHSQSRTGSTSASVNWDDLSSNGFTESAIMLAVEIREATVANLFDTLDEVVPDSADGISADAPGLIYTGSSGAIAQPPSGTNLRIGYGAGGSGGAALQIDFCEGESFGAVFLPRRWKRQPQGPTQVDWGNPLTRGLLVAVIGGQRANLATGRLPDITQTVSQRALLSGLNWSSASGGGYLEFGALPVLSAVSFGALVTTAAPDSFAISSAQALGLQGISIPLGFGSVPGTNGVRVATSSSEETITGTYSTTQPVHIAGVWSQGAPLLQYRNGVFVNQGAALGGTITSSTGLRLFRRGDTAPAGDVSVAFAFVSARVMSACEIAALHENPWQLFRTRRARFYSLPAPVIKSVTTGTLGANAEEYVTVTPAEYAAVTAWPWTPKVRVTSL
jgi:hypothetical protein